MTYCTLCWLRGAQPTTENPSRFWHCVGEHSSATFSPSILNSSSPPWQKTTGDSLLKPLRPLKLHKVMYTSATGFNCGRPTRPISWAEMRLRFWVSIPRPSPKSSFKLPCPYSAWRSLCGCTEAYLFGLPVGRSRRAFHVSGIQTGLLLVTRCDARLWRRGRKW